MTALAKAPAHWRQTTIGEIAEVRLGRQRSPKNHTGDQMQPYLRAANVNWYRLRPDDIQKMNFTAEEMETYALREHDILVVEGSGSATEVGKCALVPSAFAGHAFQNTLIRIRPKADVDPRWLMYRINAEAELGGFLALARGSGIFHLGSTRTAKWPAAVPPLDEQHAIVETIERMLSQLDAAASETQRGLRRLSVLRDALAHAAVSGGLLGLPRGGNGEWSTPPTWRWRNVSDVAEIRGGIQKTPARQPVRNTAPFLRVANVQRDELELSDVHNVELNVGELDRYRLRQGDLLVVEGNGSLQHIGRSAVWDGSIADCVHQNHLIRVRPGVEITSGWLNVVWNSPSCSAQIQQVSQTTSGLYTLSTKKVGAVSIPVPPRDVQLELVDVYRTRLTQIQRLESAVATSLKRGFALRRSILKAAFEGRLTTASAPPVEEL
ncbi:MAG: restriction endonuclease subunit S, partial [Phycisphaeraceae bacterium]